MIPIKHLTSGINITPLLWSLQQHPELWNQNPERTQSPDSPHHDLSDIWCRFSQDGMEYKDTPHYSIWYPCADQIEGLKDIVFSIMNMVRGEQLGGVLITKVPAWKQCKPHIDEGWHARHYEKFAVSIASHPKQEFCFEGHSLVTKPGDLWWFDNQYPHWVTNQTEEARITLIMSIKIAPNLIDALRGE